MNVDLSLYELKVIQEHVNEKAGVTPVLKLKLETALWQAEELEGLDLNDCGDACKL